MPEIHRVTVVGAGVLGAQIAYHTAYKGLAVTVHDISPEALAAAEARMHGLGELYKADGVEGADRGLTGQAFTRLTFTTDLAAAVAQADLVIEAVPEVLDLKRQVFGELGRFAPEHTVFATNSSTLLPSDLKDSTGRPDRFLAIHYANLIWKMNVAEIMGTPDTDPDVFAAAVAFAKATGMVPVELHKEQAGYILNSLLVPLLFSAGTLWVNGVATPETIDAAWRIASQSPFGPFQTLDVIGLKTAYNVAAAAPDPNVQAFAAALKEQYIDKGKLGTTTGEGFYAY